MNKITELVIYGNSAKWLVSEGIKLFTLRLNHPKYSNLQAGSNIIIRYDQGFDFGIVFSRDVKPLKDYSNAELLLDGFLSTEEALENLRLYPGYEDINLDTPLLGIGFTSTSHFQAYLNEEKRQLLINTPLCQAVKLPELHHLFLPSYLWWLILKNDQNGSKITVKKWHSLLSKHLHIFDQEKLYLIRNVDEATKSFYSRLRHKTIMEILKYESTVSPKYKSLVVCQSISIIE